MLSRYIQAAMNRARYELLEEGWIVLGLRLGHEIPPIGRVKLETEKAAA
ncbi:MAG: hypothetical protein AAB217_02275 [Chloroflexota bacterium]